MVRPLAMALALVCLAAWPAEAAEWPQIERALRPELSRLLSPAQVRRLLARRDIRRALVETFHAWDGVDDQLDVTRGDAGEVVIRVIAGERALECVARLGGSEGGASDPICEEVVRSVADDRVELGRELYRRRARSRPKPPRVARPEPSDPVDTLLRKRTRDDPYAPELTDTVRRALVAWSELRGAMATRHWKDPFLPELAYETGRALVPPAPFSPLLEGRAIADLRNPFDEARMGAKLDLPVPRGLHLSRDVNAAAIVKPLVAECLEEWAARDTKRAPPSLDCFRRVSDNRRLDDSASYQVLRLLSFMGLNTALPFLNDLMRLEQESAASHRDYNVTWAVVWLEWARQRPTRLGSALGALSREERSLLRRRLWRWWIKPNLAPYHALISNIYERHFLALYPEARDGVGLPRRAFFNSTWLWASNWLSETNHRPAAVVLAAYSRLGQRERDLIDGFVADQMIASRFPAACGALRR